MADRASKSTSCICTTLGVVLVIFYGGYIFEYLFLPNSFSQADITDVAIIYIVGLIMLSIGVVLIKYNIENRWGLGPKGQPYP